MWHDIYPWLPLLIILVAASIGVGFALGRNRRDQ
jgi:hypothetical protein